MPISILNEDEGRASPSILSEDEFSPFRNESISRDEYPDILYRIRDFLHDQYGIYFAEAKLFLLQSKLRKLARSRDCESLEEYYSVLRDNDGEIPRLLDQVSTNKTNFYREQKHWRFLRNQILPEFDGASFRGWSAACSSGEEPFTLGMELEEHRRQSSLEDYRILGTDLSNEVLRQAVNGVYRGDEINPVRKCRPDFVSRYFNSCSSGYEVDSALQERVCFRTFNLRKEDYPFSGTFQLILCRNVLIYFDDDMIEHVVNELTSCLEPGGYLLIGHTENLNNIDHDLQRIRPAIFRKGDYSS